MGIGQEFEQVVAIAKIAREAVGWGLGGNLVAWAIDGEPVFCAQDRASARRLKAAGYTYSRRWLCAGNRYEGEARVAGWH